MTTTSMLVTIPIVKSKAPPFTEQEDIIPDDIFMDPSSKEVEGEQISNALLIHAKQKEKYRKERKGKRTSPRDRKGVLHAAPAKHSALVKDSLAKQKKLKSILKRDERQILDEVSNYYAKSSDSKKIFPWNDVCTVVNVFREIAGAYIAEFYVSTASMSALELLGNCLEDGTACISYNDKRLHCTDSYSNSRFCLIIPENLSFLAEDSSVNYVLNSTISYLWNLV